MKKLILLIFCFHFASAFSWDASTFKWWNPAQNEFPVIEGQAWRGELKLPYDRLPSRAEGKVKDDVWHLSSQSAGLMIRFRSNAGEIKIRYGTKWNRELHGPRKNYGMDHMPATGVSGVDLYAIDSDGNELWCAGRRSFADTIAYSYESLNPNDKYHHHGREYRLYLPLYNQVEWMEIGVDETAYFEPLPIRNEKPIVVYGTSIVQGACASRPGMAWTAILSRKMDRPLINLGFSGSGRLELPVIDLIGEIDAKIYIIDCMPNLIPGTWSRNGINSDQEFKNRVLESIRQLKAKQPDIPILLVDHAGYTEEFISYARKDAYSQVNKLQQEAFYQLKKDGFDNLYYLTREEIGLQLDDMVDGTHPNDLGMMHYAKSYEERLRAILKEPLGKSSTTQPVTQYREPDNYDWEHRHRDILKLITTDPPKIVFLANSIIHFWGGLPRTKLVREEGTWQSLLTPMGVGNYAYGWDRIENVLWRVYHGELDNFEAEKVLVMIGTNNLHLNTDDEIIEGLNILIKAIKIRQPNAKIVLLGLLPRRDQEQRVSNLNMQISRLAGDINVKYADLGPVFLNDKQKIQESYFSDGLHPNANGYMKLRDALKPVLYE